MKKTLAVAVLGLFAAVGGAQASDHGHGHGKGEHHEKVQKCLDAASTDAAKAACHEDGADGHHGKEHKEHHGEKPAK